MLLSYICCYRDYVFIVFSTFLLFCKISYRYLNFIVVFKNIVARITLFSLHVITWIIYPIKFDHSIISIYYVFKYFITVKISISNIIKILHINNIVSVSTNKYFRETNMFISYRAILENQKIQIRYSTIISTISIFSAVSILTTHSIILLYL